jgi:23S rRNA U2552 (ribose-2'-O)-methylase RlmE/FtsJ
MDIINQEREPPPWKCYTLYKGEIQDSSLNLLSLQTFPCLEQQYLEELRQSISEYDKTPLFFNDNWEYYKKIVNPYELVYTQNKYSNFPQSVCILRPLSRSYFKMIELLEIFKFFYNLSAFEKSRGIRSAHTCEGPGGFIEALFDLAEKNRVRISQSTAITLRPLLPNVPGWKRATNFLSRNKNIKIIYGEDRSGDILNIKNQDFFIKEVNNESKVHIYTADGGLDFSDDYLHQEDKIFPLLLASVKIGLAVLKNDGMMIMKFFDIQNQKTTQLLYLLQSFFRQWTLYKPSVSRPCNPEQYFVGIGFKGCSKEFLDRFDRWQNNISLIFLKDGIDSSFLNNMSAIQSNLISCQIKYLKQIFSIICKIRTEFHTTGKTEISMMYIQDILNKNIVKCIEWCRTFSVPIRQGIL